MAMKKSANAADFIALKTRVKAEMTRRNGNGSLTAYAGTTYDFTIQPRRGTPVRIEHYNKIRDLMAAINPTLTRLPAKKRHEAIPTNMTILDAQLTVFESRPRGERSTNDCASVCTGTCISACTTACIGCDGCTSCDGCSGCGSGCDGCSGCGSGCAGCSGCGGGCDSSCSGMCVGCSGCDSTCQGDCSNSSC